MCVQLSKFLFIYVCVLSCFPLPHYCSPQICGNGDGIVSVFLRTLHSIIAKKPVVLLLPPPPPPHSKSGKQGHVFAGSCSYSLALLPCPMFYVVTPWPAYQSLQCIVVYRCRPSLDSPHQTTQHYCLYHIILYYPHA